VPSLADLSDAGGWVIFAFSAFWLGIGFHRGWIIPGWIYRQEREQRLKAEIQAERNSESLALLARFADARRTVSSDELP
jgi:hypothetical protein